MPIDRTAFNALIDDDGSNSLGTPWNKAAIAGTILDPVDAALGLTPLGSAQGTSGDAVAGVLANVPVPALVAGDALRVAVVAVLSGGAALMTLTLRVYDALSASFQDAVDLTGVTGAGDFAPSAVLIARVDSRQLPAGITGLQSLGSGALTAGVTQARGFPFGRLCPVGLTAPGNFLYLGHGGVPAGATLYWAWTVHLLKG